MHGFVPASRITTLARTVACSSSTTILSSPAGLHAGPDNTGLLSGQDSVLGEDQPEGPLSEMGLTIQADVAAAHARLLKFSHVICAAEASSTGSLDCLGGSAMGVSHAIPCHALRPAATCEYGVHVHVGDTAEDSVSMWGVGDLRSACVHNVRLLALSNIGFLQG